MLHSHGLGLNFKINKIAFSIFDISIAWYAIIIVSGIILDFILSKKDDGLYNLKWEKIIDMMIIVLPISIVCARIYYVIFNFSIYDGSILKMINIRDGGLAIYGGLIGGAITCILYCKKNNMKILDVLDFIAPYVILAQAIGRWGNFMNVEAYGGETSLPWRMGIFEGSKYIEVHPTFLYESLGNFLIFLFLMFIRKKRKFSGEITLLYALLYSFIRMFIEGLRTDSLMLGNFRISQVLSLVIFIISFIILVKKVIFLKKCNVNDE